MTRATDTRDAALAALLAQKQQIERNLIALQKACTSDVDRATLAHSYTSAVVQYETALTKALVVNDGEVLRNVALIGAIQGQIQQGIEEAAAITETLNRIAQGIQIGSRIVTLMA